VAVQALDENIAADAVQFALPLLDQMRRRDNQHHLIVRDLSAQLLDDTCRQRYRGGAADQSLADPHLSNEQNAVARLKATHRRADHMLLRGVHRVFALQSDTIQPAPCPGKIERIHGFELLVEITRQGTLVSGDEAQQRLIPFHLDHRTILRQQRQCGSRFQSNGGFLDLPFRVAGGGFDFDAGNLLNVLGLTAYGDLPVVLGMDDCAVGNACRQHQCHMSGTWRNHRFDLLWRTGNFQQCLKTVGLPCALLLDQPQALFFVDDVGGENKACDLRWRRQLVEGF